MHHLASSEHDAPGEIPPVEQGSIETGEGQSLIAQSLDRLTAGEPQIVDVGSIPGRGARSGEIETVVEAPAVCADSVEALVVHRRHELCLCRLVLRREDAKGPGLFLSRCELVAERFPRRTQSRVRHGPADLCLMAVKLSINDPRHADGEAVAHRGIVGERTGEDIVVDGLRAALYLFLAGED